MSRQSRRVPFRAGPPAVAAAAALLLAGCATAAPEDGADGASASSGAALTVVAAENFWGEIAQELGGDRVQVTSIVSGPGADPHDYEPQASDAMLIGDADVVLINGLGYDTWAGDLEAANGSDDDTVLVVGDVLGLSDGDNPHQWYSPTSVRSVAEAITDAYTELDPDGASAYATAQDALFSETLGDYYDLVDEIFGQYAGTSIGASESIVQPLADATGLEVDTPEAFVEAVSEGVDPAASDVAEALRQVTDGEVAVYLYNAQNATPDVQRQVEAAQAAGIPVVTVTETIPEGETYASWQTAQLQALYDALAGGATASAASSS